MHNVRVSFYQLSEGGDIDNAVESFKEAIPDVLQMDGNNGVLLLIDREGGKAITLTLWESPESMNSSSQQADSVRQQVAGTGGLTIQGVEHYSLEHYEINYYEEIPYEEVASEEP